MQERLSAIIYCERGMLNPVGKTAHGLIRHSERYEIAGVVDSQTAGADAGELVDGKPRGIPVFPTIEKAVKETSPRPHVLVVGLAPTGFRGEGAVIDAAEIAIECGLSIHSGLHLFLSDLPKLREAAANKGVELLDVRKPPSRKLQMFSGAILNVKAPRLLVTGQDAAVGKRTASIRICRELKDRGIRTCLIGTGQTAWLQGFEYGVRLDALPLDFAAGELEREILRANELESPDIFIVEGQGSLLNPGYSCETMILLTSCRPSMMVYVSAPERSHYVDFPDFKVRDAGQEIDLLEAITGASIVGIVVHCQQKGEHHHESLSLKRRMPTSFGPDGDLGPILDKVIDTLSPHG